jgi:glutamate synthase domain-containing protein 3
MTNEDFMYLKALLTDYYDETGSAKANYILSDWDAVRGEFMKFLPIGLLKKRSQTATTKIA